ncbi:MAG: SDR family NAD(P)-dependent oxidoreductase [Thermodesulfobacteriota bacterium]
MRELRGRVAVVTGAASGIGRALAARFAADGMRVCLADVERGPLERAAEEIAAAGAEILAVPTDVARAADVEALREHVLARFGAVHVVCNNAGVSLGGPVWEASLDDWRWVLGVNLWGVIHGVRTFVPLLVAQDEGHVVNTASMAGLTSNAGSGVYNVSKHGVVTLSETLYRDLAARGARVGVSLLCPSFVATSILDSARNRQREVGGDATRAPAPSADARRRIVRGLAPSEVAERVVDAIRAERFWVLTHPETVDRVRRRLEDVVAGRNPGPA